MSIEKIVNIIANKIALELNLTSDKKEVMVYGAFTLIHTILSIALVLIFGKIFGVIIESLIISFTTSILRKYSGGAHASSPNACTFIGTVVCIGQAIVVVNILGIIEEIRIITVIGILTFAWAYYLINKLAPVDNPVKPIRSKDKRNKMKKKSILTLSVYLVIVVLGIIDYYFKADVSLLGYTMCICFGILWQVFTLTRNGHKFLHKIDIYLNNIF